MKYLEFIKNTYDYHYLNKSNCFNKQFYSLNLRFIYIYYKQNTKQAQTTSYKQFKNHATFVNNKLS